MKNSGILVILAAFLFLASCADKPARPDTLLSEAQKSAADAAASAAANAGIQGAPAGISDLPHYYCANNCEGSGGDSQANCPTCGTAYTHNAAFHNKVPTTTQPVSTTPVVGADGTITAPMTTPLNPTAVTPPPSPAQNANGVYHYTCSAGCAGGAAGAGTCASCGGALAHNAEYHN